MRLVSLHSSELMHVLRHDAVRRYSVVCVVVWCGVLPNDDLKLFMRVI